MRITFYSVYVETRDFYLIQPSYFILSFQQQIVQALTNAGLSVTQSSSRKRKRSDDDADDFSSSNHKREFVDKNDSIILIE